MTTSEMLRQRAQAHGGDALLVQAADELDRLAAAASVVVEVAAALAQRKPLQAIAPLTGVSHIGHRQMARAYDKANEDTRLLAIKLAQAAHALAPTQETPR